MKRYTHKVTFSTDRETFQHLEARASMVGMTAHQVARELLEAKVQNQDENILLALNLIAQKLDTVAQQTERNSEELGEFRRVIADDFTSLSQFLNKLADRVEATHKMVTVLSQAQSQRG